MSTDIEIATLQPFEPLPNDSAAIRAEVSLLWPYSSSTESSALLLVDPDYRKRHRNGQIRVRFHGGAAKALARSHIGIGDLVQLKLAGARWRDADERALNLTPGKPIHAELLYERSLHLTVLEDGSGSIDGRTVEVEELRRSPRRQVHAAPSTPAPKSSGVGSVGLTSSFTGDYATPGLMKRLRLSQQQTLNSPGLADDAERLDDSGSRKRRRVSYKSVAEWKHAEASVEDLTGAEEHLDEVDSLLEAEGFYGSAETRENHEPIREGSERSAPNTVAPAEQLVPSSDRVAKQTHQIPDPGTSKQPVSVSSTPEPELEEVESEDEDVFDAPNGPGGTAELQTQSTYMRPPPLPQLKMPPPVPLPTAPQSTSNPSTPKLQPIPAALLPLPSPFPFTPLAQTPTTNAFDEAKVLQANTIHDSPSQKPKMDYFGVEAVAAEEAKAPAMQTSESHEIMKPTPLVEVIRQPDIIESHVEGHASPSSGSDADISSEEDMAAPEPSRQTSPPLPEPTPTIASALDGAANQRSHPVLPPEEPFDENHSSIEAMDGETRTRAEGPGASRDTSETENDIERELAAELEDHEPSDDDEDIPVPSDLATHITDPDKAIIEDPSNVTDVVEGGMDIPLSQAQSDFAASPTSIAPILSSDAQTSAAAKVDDTALQHESQDEDAAFAAMDEAMHDLDDAAIELQQAPAPPLASTLAPSRRPSEAHAPAVRPVLDFRPQMPIVEDAIEGETNKEVSPLMEDDHKEALQAVEDTDGLRPSGFANDEPRSSALDGAAEDVGEPSNFHFQDAAEPTTKPQISLMRLTQQARDRSIATDKMVYIDMPEVGLSSAVEVVDLSGKEAEPVRQHLEHLRVPMREMSVADSVESGATTLAVDSSRPGTRAGYNATEIVHPVLPDDDVQPSQELGSTPAVAFSRAKKDQRGRLYLLSEPDAEAEKAERDFDEKLLAGLDGCDDLKPPQSPPEVRASAYEAGAQDENDANQASKKMSPTQSKLKDSRRLSSRLSVVPNALNAWFTKPSPKTSVSSEDRRKTTSIIPEPAPPASTAPGKASRQTSRSFSKRNTSVSPPPLRRYAQSQGLMTSLTYLTPLTNLDLHLNNPSAKIDIIAVATRASDEVRRAKSGPRDWYTIFHITDVALYEQQMNANTASSQDTGEDLAIRAEKQTALREDIRVEVFRPWKASLPSVSESDAILLRNFTVRSRGRRNYLLSGEESSWCAFRTGSTIEDVDLKGQNVPVWARKADDAVKEEVRGPPCEVGEVEREKARELRGWWELVSRLEEKGRKRTTL